MCYRTFIGNEPATCVYVCSVDGSASLLSCNFTFVTRSLPTFYAPHSFSFQIPAPLQCSFWRPCPLAVKCEDCIDAQLHLTDTYIKV
jgi:hypothetical protein